MYKVMNRIMKLKVNKDHRGFSLIELIVSMLVASIVVIAIGGLMAVGTSVFKSANTETELQKESQIAMNQMNDILIKATQYEYFAASVDVDVLLITTSREEYDSLTVTNNYYAIILDKNKDRLLFKKATNVDLVAILPKDWAKTEALNEVASSEPSLLSRYVDSVNVSPISGPTITNDVVQVTLNLTLSDKDYSTFITVKLRNH